jgi:hypothetical protein
MAQGVLIVGESGSGKSTAVENLNPAETFIINVANKPLPFRGWKKKYSVWDSKANPKGNMFASATPNLILACIDYINSSRPEVKNIVIDDFQYMSSFEFFDRADEKGYDKFTQIGAWLVKVSKKPQTVREDLMIFYLTHAEVDTDMSNKRRVKAKTIGKMVDDKLTLEGLFSVVLFSRLKKDKEGNLHFVFETQNNGENTCKSPRGMFPGMEIPNDLQLVRKAILEYETGEPEPKASANGVAAKAAVV